MSVTDLALVTALAVFPAARALAAPETVHFPSEDGGTKLVGYLFRPSGGGRHAAIVLLHGRAGPYFSLAKGRYDATTLSKRHKEWGAFWAQRGYVALLVDSFGPRGKGQGFGRGSYSERPAEVSEQTVRPLDAYGGMTVLVTMSDRAPGIERPSPETGFRAGLALSAKKKQSVAANAQATEDAMRRAEKFFGETLAAR